MKTSLIYHSVSVPAVLIWRKQLPEDFRLTATARTKQARLIKDASNEPQSQGGSDWWFIHFKQVLNLIGQSGKPADPLKDPFN